MDRAAVGPGFQVDSWAHYDSTEGGRDGDERVVEWPPTWLTGCPAYASVPPAGFRGHRGGFAGDDAVRLDLTGVGIGHTTGGQAGIPGLETCRLRVVPTSRR